MVFQFSGRFGDSGGPKVELMAGQFASLRFLADPSAPAIKFPTNHFYSPPVTTGQ